MQFANGDGTFSALTKYPILGGAHSIAAGDFNNDGRMDLAVISRNFLYIFLNQGAGVLKLTYSYPLVNRYPLERAIKAGNLNGDHNTDLLLIDQRTNTVTPYFATSSGAFTQGGTYGTARLEYGIAPQAAIGDINNDGYPDIAVATVHGVTLLLGSSTGAFTPGRSIIDSNVRFVALEDFNKDGKLDLAFTTASDFHLSVLFGNGDGTFADARIYGTLGLATSLIVADVNGDGSQDLVTTDYVTGGLSILLNQGNGYFRAAPVTHSKGATGIATADFNRDGKPDMALVNTPDLCPACRGTVSVFMGTGSDWFQHETKYPIAMHGLAIAAGDLQWGWSAGPRRHQRNPG